MRLAVHGIHVLHRSCTGRRAGWCVTVAAAFGGAPAVRCLRRGARTLRGPVRGTSRRATSDVRGTCASCTGSAARALLGTCTSLRLVAAVRVTRRPPNARSASPSWARCCRRQRSNSYKHKRLARTWRGPWVSSWPPMGDMRPDEGARQTSAMHACWRAGYNCGSGAVRRCVGYAHGSTSTSAAYKAVGPAGRRHPTARTIGNVQV
jgi:hypothetical protein